MEADPTIGQAVKFQFVLSIDSESAAPGVLE